MFHDAPESVIQMAFQQCPFVATQTHNIREMDITTLSTLTPLSAGFSLLPPVGDLTTTVLSSSISSSPADEHSPSDVDSFSWYFGSNRNGCIGSILVKRHEIGITIDKNCQYVYCVQPFLLPGQMGEHRGFFRHCAHGGMCHHLHPVNEVVSFFAEEFQSQPSIPA